MTQHLRLTTEQFNAINAKGVKRAKYGNRKKEIGGRVFDSVREATRFQELALMQHNKDISDLRCQVEIACVVNNMLVCRYYADFVYFDDHGNKIVEDSKGKRTEAYIIKKKLVQACTGIVILET